jgi:hypothetical protein
MRRPDLGRRDDDSIGAWWKVNTGVSEWERVSREPAPQAAENTGDTGVLFF